VPLTALKDTAPDAVRVVVPAALELVLIPPHVIPPPPTLIALIPVPEPDEHAPTTAMLLLLIVVSTPPELTVRVEGRVLAPAVKPADASTSPLIVNGTPSAPIVDHVSWEPEPNVKDVVVKAPVDNVIAADGVIVSAPAVPTVPTTVLPPGLRVREVVIVTAPNVRVDVVVIVKVPALVAPHETVEAVIEETPVLLQPAPELTGRPVAVRAAPVTVIEAGVEVPVKPTAVKATAV